MSSTSTDFDAKYITWECTTQCNYSCSYCWPACHDGKYRWPDSDKTNRLIDYIKNFSDGKTVVLDIMGGEPTLWPDLERFCCAVGDRSLITFSSNGSRTARWWRDFTAPIDHLIFSYHPEYADNQHFVQMLQEVQHRYRTTVMILYHPKFKQTCLSAWDCLTNSNLDISVKFKKIISADTCFSAEDYQILNKQYFKSKVTVGNTSMNMYIDCLQVDPDDLITTGKNSFLNWQCNLGQNYRYINAAGDVRGAACSVAPKLGNIFVDDSIDEPVPVICSEQYCNCKPDMILNNKYEIC